MNSLFRVDVKECTSFDDLVSILDNIRNELLELSECHFDEDGTYFFTNATIEFEKYE